MTAMSLLSLARVCCDTSMHDSLEDSLEKSDIHVKINLLSDTESDDDSDEIECKWNDHDQKSSDWQSFLHAPDGSIMFENIVETEKKQIQTHHLQSQHREFQQNTNSTYDQQADEAIDYAWIVKACAPFATFDTETGETIMTEEDLAKQILKILQEDKYSETECATQLWNMLGDAGFELVGKIVEKRAQIQRIEMENALNRSSGDCVGNGSDLHNKTRNLVGVSVNSTSQKKQERQMRKMEKKMARQSMPLFGASQDLIIDNQKLEEQASSLKAWISGDAKQLVSGLPAGSTRMQHKGYEEVAIPPNESNPVADDDLLPITAFPEWARLAFPGVKKLNRIQSKVHDAAFKHNNNLLVCAPTGAGKTNVAMMAVLHEIGQHIRDGILQHRDNFKIIYVAPMKALAQEVQQTFQRRLTPLGLVVKELTGDAQLTKREIQETHMIVTTPEKWDVMTRKSNDDSLVGQVRVLIIDEVHLLHEERGPVIEILVARTLRRVEATQRTCRIVGLSATLPNYRDVAVFLGVNLQTGLFFFDSSYRPVPLSQYYIGIQEKNSSKKAHMMNEICYKKALQSLRQGNQAMIFVHSRRATFETARALRDLAAADNAIGDFECIEHPQWQLAEKKLSKGSRNSELIEIFRCGFAMHHAGMVRHDRALVEEFFSQGLISVLVCTATLAWGVNLPAHTVIIKGTEIYDAKRGGFVDVGMTDVMQIFGRAGRPQFDSHGEGILVTDSVRLPHYLTLLNNQLPIESQFTTALADHLNAEIVLGTVSTVKEAVSWLSYTYLFTRMMRNPMVYGITYEQLASDPLLVSHREELIVDAAKTLMLCRMIKFDSKSGNFFSTDVGRVASHYYINHRSIEEYNSKLKVYMPDEDIFELLAASKEFEQIKARDEELREIERLSRKYCPVKIKSPLESQQGKTNLLLQAYISNAPLDGATLISDQYYITQSAGRISRALFEIVLKCNKMYLSQRLLSFTKMIDKRQWDFQHPLRQFPSLKHFFVERLEEKSLNLDKILDMPAAEVGIMIRQPKSGIMIQNLARQIPYIELDATVQPVTRSVLRVTLRLQAAFDWNDRHHGGAQGFWILVEDGENEVIYHHEYFLLGRKRYMEPHVLDFAIPIFEPMPSQYHVRAISDHWFGGESEHSITFKHLLLPETRASTTQLLNLHPIPLTALNSSAVESMYNFTHFNPIQSQVFHTLYHTDNNVLLGAPTGSGKTIVAELAIHRLFSAQPGAKVVYIAPLKALARERITEWSSAKSFKGRLNKAVIELTGDTAPDIHAIKHADIIITTPEKWDGVSRNWKTRSYVQQVGLIVIDEIHLLGADRGPVLEVIVSRIRYISAHTERKIRVIGLSTALANSIDLADWLGIDGTGMYNFSPSVRPVPLSIHIAGFSGRHYCPRMQTMNKPAYAAIMTHSPDKPVLIFVSSRRQTRLTALDIISHTAADGNPQKFLRTEDNEIEAAQRSAHDPYLKHMLSFGIGIHHSGLVDSDRTLVEKLFLTLKIQVLVCTATLAWGVNLPAHLVIIKGTEYFDAKLKQYVDFPITDVLQMMGRAGRPQFDNEGKACVFVQDSKKNYYMNFLHSPFPVESSLMQKLHDHINAEIVGGTITSLSDAVDYLTWTFLFRRLLMNPSYYGLVDTSSAGVNDFIFQLLRNIFTELALAGCIEVAESLQVKPTRLGIIASYYYLHYTTMRVLTENISVSITISHLLETLSDCHEYSELPVRHNEDQLNESMMSKLRFSLAGRDFLSPHLKANLLLQYHCSRLPLPISDYVTDCKSVLDQAIRIMQAMVDVAAAFGYQNATLTTVKMMQMVVQGRWYDDHPLLQLTNVTEDVINSLHAAGLTSLRSMIHTGKQKLMSIFHTKSETDRYNALVEMIVKLPLVDISARLTNCEENENASSSEHASACTNVHLEVLVCKRSGQQGLRAMAPLFPKPKDEQWFLAVCSNVTNDRLFSLKRITLNYQQPSMHSFTISRDLLNNSSIHVRLLSDCYLGVDTECIIDIR